MKKTILLLFVITAATLAACKKEKEKKSRKDDLGEYIQRTWYTIDEKSSYYNEANALIYEETDEPGVSYRLNDGEVKFKDVDKSNTFGSYILSNSDGKDIITVILDGKTEAYEIVSIDDSLMTWKQELHNVTYIENGQQKNAAKKIYTLNMHCPCH